MAQSDKLSKESLQVRLVQECELEDVLEMLKQENLFIQSRAQLDIVHREKLGVIYVLVDNSQSPGKVLAMANISKTRDNEAYLGDVITQKELRGQGLGSVLVRRVLEYHSDVIVNWFSSADEFYLKLGSQIFDQPGLYVEMKIDREKVTSYCNENDLGKNVEVVAFTEDRMEDLFKYDTDARGYEMHGFVSYLTRTSDDVSVAVTGSNRNIVGYLATSCKDPVGTMLLNGLYANDERIAIALLRRAAQMFPLIDKARLFTLNSRRFLLQFGEVTVDWKQSRFTHGLPPARIPEAKLYCLSQPDLAY